MSPAAAPPRATPLARVRLERVRVRGVASPGGAPVFEYFEEMARRSAEAPPSNAGGARFSTRA